MFKQGSISNNKHLNKIFAFKSKKNFLFPFKKWEIKKLLLKQRSSSHHFLFLKIALQKLKSTIQILHNIFIFFPFLIKLDKFLTKVYLIYDLYIINIFFYGLF